MDLTQLADLGEFIGGVAVLVTLVYLAMQIKGNGQSERAESHRSFIQDFNQSFFGPMQDAATAELLRRAAVDYRSLDGVERMRVAAIWAPTLLLCQEGHFLYQVGSIEAELAETIDTFTASMLQVPGVAMWWEEMGQGFIPSFQTHVSRLLAAASPAPPMSDMWSWFSEESSKNGGAQ